MQATQEGSQRSVSKLSPAQPIPTQLSSRGRPFHIGGFHIVHLWVGYVYSRRLYRGIMDKMLVGARSLSTKVDLICYSSLYPPCFFENRICPLCLKEKQKYSWVPDHHHLKNPTIVYETWDDSSSTRDLLLKEILRQMGLVSCKLLPW